MHRYKVNLHIQLIIKNPIIPLPCELKSVYSKADYISRVFQVYQ